jgi:GH15 family glucan-1,4-alpha-glucosidase
MSYEAIENHGIIGNLRTVALVAMDGSISLLCVPAFDSPSVFASLLDDRRGGRFQISTRLDDVTRRQLYLPETNVLLTRFLSRSGVSELSDFMPMEGRDAPLAIVRRIKTVHGEIPYTMVCAPRFDYARATHTAQSEGGDAILFQSRGRDGLALRLRADVPMKIVDGDAVAQFTLGAGQTASFVLEQALPGRPSPARGAAYVARSFKQTVNFWRGWARASTYRGRWRETVHRSALALKLLVSAPHGAMVAAPTFSLPEYIGGERNWDYRYTWIRDASFTLYALIRLGYTGEAAAFMGWIERRCAELAEGETLQTVYRIDGGRELTEITLDHLEGYAGSRPVRVGNAAHHQLQLDIYGELMDSVYLYNKYGEPISYDLWQSLSRLVEWVCEHWRTKDEGIWEIRGPRQAYLYSRVLCWVAVDRAVRLAVKRSFPAPLGRWIAVRDSIYKDIFTNFWSRSKHSFVQRQGSEALDASCLIMPLVKFVGPTDPRWLSTLRAIRMELVADALVFRYRPEEAPPDGMRGEEGTFNMCSFWYAECLSRAGDLEAARLVFEKMLGYANHLGLYSEETGPRGEHLGNFPQAFTHLALISAAYNLDLRLSHKTIGSAPTEKT